LGTEEYHGGQSTGLSASGKALVVTQIFRLLFGGYLIGTDWYHYNDSESALTVLVIYVLLGIFTAMFVYRKKFGLGGILWLSIILIVFTTVFTVLTMVGTIEGGPHNPADNWWATILRYVFFLLTLIFSVKVYRESGQRRQS
jgi:predicted permease